LALKPKAPRYVPAAATVERLIKSLLEFFMVFGLVVFFVSVKPGAGASRQYG